SSTAAASSRCNCSAKREPRPSTRRARGGRAPRTANFDARTGTYRRLPASLKQPARFPTTRASTGSCAGSSGIGRREKRPGQRGHLSRDSMLPIRRSRARVRLPARCDRESISRLRGRSAVTGRCSSISALRSAFWERVRDGRYRDAAFFRCERQPFVTNWTQLPVRSTLVVAWVGGPKAVALSGIAEAELIERALNGFGALLNEPELAREEFEGGLTHDWGGDPFARGAYSYVAVGGGNARAALSAPVDDTRFFAGEATSTDDQDGTVNGALETGERAAAEAATALGVEA